EAGAHRGARRPGQRGVGRRAQPARLRRPARPRRRRGGLFAGHPTRLTTSVTTGARRPRPPIAKMCRPCHTGRRRVVMSSTMTPRLQNPYKHAQEGIKAMMALEASFTSSGLGHGLTHLVKLRASQINGCAFCIHMHATDARKAGETEMRLYML